MTTIYTDGAFSSASKTGAAAYVVVEKGIEAHSESQSYQHSRFEPVTSQRMELLAAIHALQWSSVNRPMRKVTIMTDSKYLVNCMTRWVMRWSMSGWKKADGVSDVANRDLLEQLIELTTSRFVNWRWVKGHNGDEWNERADALAVQAIEQSKAVFA